MAIAERSGNEKVNDIFEARLQERSSNSRSPEKPTAESTGDTKLRFIQKKYIDRRYYRSKVHHQHVSLDAARGAPSKSTSNGSLTMFIASKANSGTEGVAERSVFSGSGKHSVGTTSTSTSSLDHNGERTKKNNDYRDPRRAEFMNSRSSLNFSMEEPDADIQRTKSSKKGPMTIKMAKVSVPSNTRMSLYQSASKMAKPRERRERGRSSSAQLGRSEASPAQSADRPLVTTMRGLGDRGDSGRSLGSSKASTRSNRDGDRGRSRSSSQARKNRAAQSPLNDSSRTPHSDKTSTIALPTRSRGRQGGSGLRTTTETDGSQGISSSDQRSRSRGSSRRSVSRSRVGENAKQRSASSTRRGTEETASRPKSPDRQRNGRSRSTPRVQKDDRLSRKAGEAAIRQASGRRLARETSRSRSRVRKSDPGKDSIDHQRVDGDKVDKEITASTDQRDLKRTSNETQRHRADDINPLLIDSSRSLKGEHVGANQQRGHKHDKSASNSFRGLDTSETKSLKGNRSFNDLSDIDDSKPIVLSSGLSKRSSSFVAVSKSRLEDFRHARVGNDLSDSIALRTSSLNDDEDGFAVISTTHKPLDTFQAHAKKSRDEPTFGAGSHGRSLSAGDGGRHAGLARRSNHSEGDPFQNAKLRMSKGKAAEMSAERASRRSNIIASLDAEENLLEADVPMTKHRISVQQRHGLSYGAKRAMSEGPQPDGGTDQRKGIPFSSLNKPSSSTQASGSVSAGGTDGSYERRDHEVDPGVARRPRVHRIPIRRSQSDISLSPGTRQQDIASRIRSTTARDFQKGIDRLERSKGTDFASSNSSGPVVRRESRPTNNPAKRRSTSSAIQADEGLRSQPMRLSDFDASFATLDFQS